MGTPTVREPTARRWPWAAGGAAFGTAVGAWLGYGIGHQFVGWWDRHSGFATLIAGALGFTVTLAYVILTASLVRGNRDSIAVATAANRLTEKALAQDRELFKLTVKSSIDRLVPVVGIRFTGVELVDGPTGRGIGSIPWKDFLLGTYRLVMTFEATNYGPEPAMLSLSEPFAGKRKIVTSGRSKPWRHPTVLDAKAKLGVELSVFEDGERVGLEWSKRFFNDESAADVEFRSTSKVVPSTFDAHTFAIFVTVDPKGGNFVPTESLTYRHSGEELPMERRYPHELT